MEVNGRVYRQNLADFKVIFDLFIFAFISFSNKNINYIRQLLWLFLKFRAKEHISLVTAQNSKRPQILATTPYWPNEYP